MLINCDMGEALSPNPDPEVMPLIDLANIACGGHAGNADTVKTTLTLAKQHQVNVGGHPSYPDQANFGRLSQTLTEAELHRTLIEQLNTFDIQAKLLGMDLHHIKPHGALYLDMMRNADIFNSILNFCQAWSPNIPLMIQGGVRDDEYQQLAEQKKVPLLFEAFADRAYLENGQLAPRSQPNSLYKNAAEIVAQTQDFIQQQKADTICFHSDNPASVEALKQLKQLK